MELLQALSQTKSRRRKRPEKRFLLPETELEYPKLVEKARKLRKERLAAIFKYGRECLSQAATLQKQAKLILSTDLENDAEYELARRDASSRKADAKKLRKKGRACISSALQLTLRFWRLPQEFDPSKDGAPSSFWSCRSWAQYNATLIERAKIVNQGEVLRSKVVPAKKDEYWHRDRQLIRFQGRIFLANLSKKIDQQPHDPWLITWVTDSPSQMTEEELRYAASQMDSAAH